jgi:osmoprotectant transport system substrate-binding protein
LTLSLGVTTAPAAPDRLRDDTVTVGSFDFAESRLLAELYSQALEDAGFRVRRAFGIGPREIVAPALADGLIEVVPEYAGTAVQFLSLGAAPTTADVTQTHEALAGALTGSRVRALAPSPAQDANTFVVTRAVAARYHLTRISDLAAVAKDLTFGGPPECATRPLCLRGLRRLYSVQFGEVVALDAGGPLTRQALANRIVDVALMFSTDPTIVSDDLVELADDRALQPAENVTPLVRTEVLDRHGTKLGAVLDAVSAHLDSRTLRLLNSQFQYFHRPVKKVAADWLTLEGLR